MTIYRIPPEPAGPVWLPDGSRWERDTVGLPVWRMVRTYDGLEPHYRSGRQPHSWVELLARGPVGDVDPHTPHRPQLGDLGDDCRLPGCGRDPYDNIHHPANRRPVRSDTEEAPTR